MFGDKNTDKSGDMNLRTGRFVGVVRFVGVRGVLFAGFLGCVGFVGAVREVPLAASVAAPQDVVIDRMLAVVNGDVVTLSDVRAARRLRLVPLSIALPTTTADAAGAARALEGLTDDALVTQVIQRRLVLTEIARYSPSDPTTEQMAARRVVWESTLPAGTNVASVLAAVGMREPALAAWLRDDLRIAAYLDQRFTAAAQPTRAQAQAYFRDHPSEFSSTDFTKVEADVRRRLAADRRAARIREWVDALVQRAEIRRLG